jgi:hypothetical protein
MSPKSLLIAICIGTAATVCGQSASSGPASFMKHASVVQAPNGQVVVTASSPRPMLQALTALRRQYGWIVDYEEGKYGADQLTLDADNRARLRGGSFQVNVAAPKSVGSADETTFLKSLISQSAAVTSQNFVLKTSSSGRQTLVTQSSAEPLMLDTPVQLSRETRTISDTVDKILALVSAKRGTPLIRGGLVDPGLLRMNVTVGGPTEVPARDLLTQALDGADIARVWSLSYEPSDGNFYIGIELAVRVETTATGEQRVTPIWNPTTSSSK